MMYIRKRSHDLHLRLNDDEFEELNIAVAKTGLSREAYLRKLISGQQPKELPPPDFRPMMRQLYYCGNNLNQIARKAHALNLVDAQQYDSAVKLFRQIVADINQAIIGSE